MIVIQILVQVNCIGKCRDEKNIIGTGSQRTDPNGVMNGQLV